MKTQPTLWQMITLTFILAAFLCSCGRSPSSTTTASAVKPPAPASSSSSAPSLVGTWTSSCLTNGPTPYTVELKFSATTLVQTVRYFNDPSCSGPAANTLPAQWTLYNSGKASSVVSGAYELNLAQPIPGVVPSNIYKINGKQLELGSAQGNIDPNTGRPQTLNTTLTFNKTA